MHLKTLAILVLLLLLLSPDMAQEQSWCGIQTLYFQHNPSTTPAGYEELINYPSGNAEVDEPVTVINTGGTVLIDNYIMPEGSMAQTTELFQGLRRYRIYSYVDSAVGTTRLNFTAFKRFSNGTEINFYSALTEDINSLTVQEYDLNYVSQSNLTIKPTDRLGIRVSANTTHSSPIVIHWIYQGATHASHFESGYFVCQQPATVNSASTTNEIPISPIIPIAGIVFVIALYSYKKK